MGPCPGTCQCGFIPSRKSKRPVDDKQPPGVHTPCNYGPLQPLIDRQPHSHSRRTSEPTGVLTVVTPVDLGVQDRDRQIFCRLRTQSSTPFPPTPWTVSPSGCVVPLRTRTRSVRTPVGVLRYTWKVLKETLDPTKVTNFITNWRRDVVVLIKSFCFTTHFFRLTFSYSCYTAVNIYTKFYVLCNLI